MLPDSSVQWLPHFVVWVDNAIIFYADSLYVILIIGLTVYSSNAKTVTIDGASYTAAVSIIAWLIYCYLEYGYALG